LLGATGTGKTTLVRQLIGTNPESERFPSTSPARTTICDFETILSDGPFSAGVSFISRDITAYHIEENIRAALMSVVEDSPSSVILDGMRNLCYC
jgi:GTPase SAR1 family protein